MTEATSVVWEAILAAKEGKWGHIAYVIGSNDDHDYDEIKTDREHYMKNS